MATASAEVLPIALTANDNTASAWQSFKRHAIDAKGAIDQLKGAIGGLEQGSAKGVAGLTDLARYAKNPYVAVAVAIAGLGVAGVAASNDLSKLADAADQVGTKGSVIAGLGSELKKVGGSVDDAIAGLKELRKQLDLNQRDGGHLEKLFEANGKSLTDDAGRVKPLEDAFGAIAEMIRQARNETERLEIATNAFGSDAAPKMVKAIMAGVTSLKELGKTELDPMIQASKELERVWDSISKKGGGWLSELKAQFAEGFSWLAIGGAALAGNQKAQQSLYLLQNPNARRGMSQNEVDEFYNAVRPSSGTKTPSNRQATPPDEYDRTLNSISKQVAMLEAEAAAVGKTAGEHQKLRIEMLQLEAARRAGQEPSEKQRAEFERLAEAARKAGDALAFAKLQSDVSFERAQLGRTDIEASIAARFRSAGIDPSSEQTAFLAEQMKINDALKTTQDISKDALKGFVADIRSGISAGEALTRVLDKVLTRLLNAGIEGGINGLTGLLMPGTPPINANGSIAGALGPTSVGGAPLVMHTGGIVGAGSARSRLAHPAHFDGAPRLHGGLVPGEFAAILQKGEGVFTREQMAALGARLSGGGAPQISVTLVERPDGAGGVSQKQNSNGGIDIEIAIAQIAARSAATPGAPLNRAITSQLGGVQRIGGR